MEPQYESSVVMVGYLVLAACIGIVGGTFAWLLLS